MPEATLTLTNTPPADGQPGQVPPEAIEVFTGGWGGVWFKRDIQPLRVVWSTADTSIGQAQLINRYGERFRSGDAGDQGAEFTPVDPLVYHLQFVRIVFGGDGLAAPGDIVETPFTAGSLFKRVWYGQIDNQTADLYGRTETEYAAGAQLMIANSMEQAVFGRHFVIESKYHEFHYRADDPDTEFDEGEFRKVKDCRHGITFNENGIGNQIGRARPNGDKVIGYGSFMTRRNRGHSSTRYHPVTWSTRNIVEYAIEHWTPRSLSGQKLFDVQISLTDLAKLPDWDAPVIETHGYRPLEILQRLVSRKRLLVWWLEVDELATDENGAPVIRFRVETTTSGPVRSGDDIAIPANEHWLALDVDRDSAKNVQLEHDNNSQIDQCIVQGARRRNVMTLKFGVAAGDQAGPGEDMETEDRGIPYWYQPIQRDYELGASRTLAYRRLAAAKRDEKKRLNDLERSRDKYTDVFTRFGMSHRPGRIDYPIPPDNPTSWSSGSVYGVGTVLEHNGVIYEVLSGTGEDSTGSSPDDDTEHTYEVWYENCFGNIRLLQKLPLLENHDYSGNKIASGQTLNGEIGPTPPNELNMFVLFYVQAKKLGTEETEGRYIHGAKLSQLGLNPPKVEEDRDWSTTVRVVPDDTSFRITVNGSKTRPHTIAKGTFTPLTETGYERWATGQIYEIGMIIEDSGGSFWKVTGGSGSSAGDDSDLGGGSDTSYSYEETTKPAPITIDEEDVGKVDWRQMVATICYEDDRFCEFVYPPKPTSLNDYKRVLRIDVGKEYKLDWMQPDSVVDIDELGQLVTSDGGYIRDDRPQLEEVARRAWGYYVLVRGILSFQTAYRSTAPPPGGRRGLTLGTLISRIRNGSVNAAQTDPPEWQPQWQIVDSVITQIRVDVPYVESSVPAERLPPPQLSITTGFGELDPKFFLPGAR